MAVLDGLSFDLIVYHPYRPLQQFVQDAQIPHAVFEAAWRIVNDSLCTTAPLVHPPFIIAIAALCLAGADQGCDMGPWLQSLDVNQAAVRDAQEAIVQFYARALLARRRLDGGDAGGKATAPAVMPAGTGPAASVGGARAAGASIGRNDPGPFFAEEDGACRPLPELLAALMALVPPMDDGSPPAPAQGAGVARAAAQAAPASAAAPHPVGPQRTSSAASASAASEAVAAFASVGHRAGGGAPPIAYSGVASSEPPSTSFMSAGLGGSTVATVQLQSSVLQMAPSATAAGHAAPSLPTTARGAAYGAAPANFVHSMYHR